MTREEVLSGVKFKWKGAVYVAQPMSNGGEGSLFVCTRHGETYECNVESFGPYSMDWYTYVMGTWVSGTINYRSLEAYVEETKAD